MKNLCFIFFVFVLISLTMHAQEIVSPNNKIKVVLNSKKADITSAYHKSIRTYRVFL